MTRLPLVVGVCGSCGAFPAPEGAVCQACAACPSVVTGPEHVSTIVPRVMADILAHAQPGERATT